MVVICAINESGRIEFLNLAPQRLLDLPKSGGRPLSEALARPNLTTNSRRQ